MEWVRLNKQPRPIVDDEDRGLIAACHCPVCRLDDNPEARIQRLKAGFEARSIHNAWILDGEVAAFRTAAQDGCLHSFLQGRLPKTWLEIVVQNRQQGLVRPERTPPAGSSRPSNHLT